MITPTIGRVVLFFQSIRTRSGPWPGLVVHVHSDRCINVGGFDGRGEPFSASSVPLLQDNDAPPESGPWAEWMPYQKGQAQRCEDLEKELAETSPRTGKPLHAA